jgi:hypothetical protein
MDDLLPTHNSAPDAVFHEFIDNVNAVANDSEGDGDADAAAEAIMITVLSTQFDPSLADNLKFPAEHDRKLNIIWTKKERELAKRGSTVGSISQLQRKVSHS